jgi:fused signal recognition particle receptor
VEIFDKMVPLTGLIMTKLDGTAKGGVVVALAEKFKKPLYALGVGESADDLKPFTPEDFARNLLRLEKEEK